MGIAEFIYTICLKPRPLRKAANLLLRLSLPKMIEVNGGTVFLNPADPVVSGGILLGVYERSEMDFFAKHCSGVGVFIDVGANVGVYTAMALARGGGEATVVCFEPHTESRQFLERTVDANLDGRGGDMRVIICPGAAADFCGRSAIYENPDNKGDNRLYPNPMCRECGTTEVVTIDDFCFQRGITTVDILKIDVQGYEAKVINGARGIIANTQNCILMLEFWPDGLARSGTCPREFILQLFKMGFSLFVLTRTGLDPVRDVEGLLATTTGRAYRNLVCAKGQNDFLNV